MRRTDIPEDELRRMYDEGYSVQAIATHFGCQKDTLRLRMAELGIAVRSCGRPIPPPIRAQIIEAYVNGDLVADICQRFSVSFNSVRNVAREAGVPSRCEAREETMRVALQRMRAGDPVKDIARDAGVTKASVYGWAKDAGLRQVWRGEGE